MKYSRYLVAGGAGFIGSHLVDRLLEHNGEVVVIDNFSSGSGKNLEHLKESPLLEVYNLDITGDLPDIHGFDAIFHLAAIANPTDYEKHPIEALLVNSRGNRNLMEIAKNSKARYYFFSSSEIYGHHEPIPSHGLTEESRTHIVLNQKRSPYYVGKIFGEEFIRTVCHESGLEVIIVRPFNIYGPRMDLKTPYGRVIPNFIRWALAGQTLLINGDGNQERSFCYIDDFLDCIIRTLEKDVIEYNVINIGNPEPISILSLAQKINDITGNQSGYSFKERYKYEPQYRTPNIERAKVWLDWRPRVKLKDGIMAIVEEYLHQGAVSYDFENIDCGSHI